ncbi:transglutaminase [Nocardioides sp. Root1257]|uniref:transglutaminase family protein n=1 Tax=unclassified Nocardioides TaxID=2615069 RepID=UPI0006F2BCF2|nr:MULTISPECIES: transglutaminase family protein [unclassified Nocardioides]KQW47831.1 transglutaminase [Nocardioides sp. Root1257]KRC45083.1 transglutaminase [Nocardioides sp. Root224]
MSVKVALEHRTTYTFAEPVNVAPHVVRLRPAPHARTPIEAYSLTVSPKNHFLNWQQDPFGNWLARLVFPEKVTELDITVGLVADLMVINPLDFFVEEYAEQFPFAYEPSLAADLAPYLRPVDDSEAAATWREALPPLPEDGVPIVQFLAGLNAAVHRDVAYSVRMETGVQTPDETLRIGIGSCRDSAWLLVSLLRQHGLAARFVSGYLVQLAADPDSMVGLDGPTGTAQDFTDLHAWAEVFVPGAGWIGLDPTSALFAGEGHIPLSATPHPSAAAPIEGATDPVEVSFSFHNEVRRVHEDPRVTRPYTDAQWARIDALGEAVDERLVAGDVRLTMGGEPTFVSRDDATTPQWSTDADGPEKRTLANDLADRLRQVYATGGVVHRGQGKWYPGEPLPRWNIALQWRTDGVPLWEGPDLFADPWGDSAGSTSGERDAEQDAEALARRVTESLGLPPEQLRAAYDDPLAALVTEVRKPVGDPADEGFETGLRPSSTTEIVTAMDADVTEVRGWVLPIATGEDDWTSPAWRFRRGRLVLTPGTSPVGLRLPLDAISWTDPEAPDQPSYLEAGPPLRPVVRAVRLSDPEGAPTTALTFEARDGHVHVFLPPTERLEDYTDLLRLVEVATRRIGCPVVLEGYGPPPDPRLTQLVVTPDPGVIEVNVQPTGSWAEQRDLTTTLYDAARHCALTTEKFDLDGLHTGTGGGNHITLGGTQPVDSPLLRRPDLLVSLITYWQRHPSLSYLFSGRFIGPTSQAPRFDEGRPEAVYEMEIAAAEIARLVAEQAEEGGEPRPWLVDRALRHLLTDLTGNTHRAEFCVDKMYSPDSSRGRLGLLELRGFEMPPHPQMALVQALLVRSLVAMFWERPLTGQLVRWGTRLHEDFLLPEGATSDIAEVAADLRAFGIPFEDAWLDPFTEFRFPRIGLATLGDDITLELRSAIEPWHVLGEEATAGGTARYVDSSVERLQVLVRGIDPSRHLVTCQGVPVPLTATSDGALYAGVRYRAWQPWSALHPSIPVHAPLRFDVVDVVAETSLGGATYHVVHPGGRSYDHPPVNAQEAEARRLGRFEPRGHTSGRIDVAAALDAGRRAATEDYPRTLDLRRVPPG